MNETSRPLGRRGEPFFLVLVWTCVGAAGCSAPGRTPRPVSAGPAPVREPGPEAPPAVGGAQGPAIFEVAEGRIRLSPAGREAMPSVAGAVGEAEITTASVDLGLSPVPHVAVSVATASDIDVARLEREGGARANIMFDARHVDATLEDGALLHELLEALWLGCLGEAADEPVRATDESFVQARRQLGEGLETRTFSFAAGPFADRLLAWAADRGLAVVQSPEGGGAPPAGGFRLRLIDGRPRGVALVCDRRIGVAGGPDVPR